MGCKRADVDGDGDGVCDPGAQFDSSWCAVAPGTSAVLVDNCPADRTYGLEDMGCCTLLPKYGGRGALMWCVSTAGLRACSQRRSARQ